MEDLYFEPGYPARHYVMVLVAALPGIAGLAVSAGLGLGRHAIILSVIAVFLLPALIRVTHVRRIVFGERLVIIRFLFGDRYCNYRQVLKIDETHLHTERGTVYIGNWTNRNALHDIIQGLKDQGRLGQVEMIHKTNEQI